MSTVIGSAKEIVDLNMGNGFKISLSFTILPANPLKHMHLFKEEAASLNNSLLSGASS